jgi:opacity protein-like surface antigen
MRFSKLMGVLGLGSVLCLASSTLYAAAPHSYQKPRCCYPSLPRHWYFDLGVGKSYDYASSNSFLVSPSVGGALDGIFKTASSYSTPFFLAGIGYLWSQDYQWLPKVSVGLQHRYTSPVNVFGLPTVTPSVGAVTSYTYKVQQENWLVMTKADIYQWKKLMPYVAAGLGVSFNRITQLFVDAGINTHKLIADPNTSSDFSYSIGAGIDYAVKNDLWLTLGYSYDSFGKNQAGPSVFTPNPGTTTLNDAVLENANLHANSVFLSARYLFA